MPKLPKTAKMSPSCHSERLRTTLSLPKGSEEESKNPENVSSAIPSQGILLNKLSLCMARSCRMEERYQETSWWKLRDAAWRSLLPRDVSTRPRSPAARDSFGLAQHDNVGNSISPNCTTTPFWHFRQTFLLRP